MLLPSLPSFPARSKKKKVALFPFFFKGGGWVKSPRGMASTSRRTRTATWSAAERTKRDQIGLWLNVAHVCAAIFFFLVGRHFLFFFGSLFPQCVCVSVCECVSVCTCWFDRPAEKWGSPMPRSCCGGANTQTEGTSGGPRAMLSVFCRFALDFWVIFLLDQASVVNATVLLRWR